MESTRRNVFSLFVSVLNSDFWLHLDGKRANITVENKKKKRRDRKKANLNRFIMNQILIG